MTTIKEKRKLYSALHKKPIDELTDNEVSIMSLLAKDYEVQDYLEEAKNAEMEN
jgi:hypothetical protein